MLPSAVVTGKFLPTVGIKLSVSVSVHASSCLMLYQWEQIFWR